MSYLTEAKQRELQQANFTETTSYLVNHYSYTTSGNRQQSQNVSKSAVDRILTEILNGSYENDADNNINTLREIKEVLGGNENIISFLGNKAIKVPSGTNAQRPDSNQQSNGQLRYNTETNSFEGYINNQWGNIGGGGGGGGSSNFTGLSDTPSNFTNSANKLLSINSNANAIEFIDKTFTSLTDTPVNYIGMANKILSVNANADGLEFINNSSGTTFTGLTETPTNLGSSGQILAVASNGTSLEFINNSSGGGSTTLVGLTDVPNDYTGHGGKVLKIKADATGIEFSDSAGGVAKFVDLTETPVSLGTVGQVLSVAAGETNLEFIDRFVIDSSNRLNANLIHDGTISNTVFGYLNGVTSNIQTQFNSKQSTIDSSNRINANLIHDGNVSNTEFGYLNGVTSDIQTQLNSKQSTIDSSNRINSDLIHDGSVSNTEFGYLNGVTSDIQTQLNSKQNILVAGTGITIDGDTINSTSSGGVDINENTDISLNNLKVHGDLSGVNANFTILSAKKLKLNNIEFNESFKTQETRVINVTAAGGKFYFDAVINPKLYLVPGITYRFNQGDSTNSTHPLRFATIDNISNTYRYSKNVTVNGTQGQAGSYTEIQVTQENKDKFYYVCSNHSGMGNEVYVLNSRNIRDLSAVDASFNGITGVNGYFTTLNSNNITVGGFTLANSNLNLGGQNIISASRQGSLTDLELKNNGNTGFLASGETGDVSMTGTLEVDVINEKTSASGVIIEGVTIKNKSITAGSNGTISATNFNVGSVNIISASRQATLRDLELKDNNGNVTLLASGDTGNVSINGILEGDISGSLTGEIQTPIQSNITKVGTLTELIVSGDLSGNDASFNDISCVNIYGNLVGNVTGDLVGDVTGNVTGTIQTATQPNITSIGDLTGLKINGDLSTNKLYVYDNIYHNKNNFNIQLGYHASNKGIASDKTFCIAIGNGSIVNESYGIAIGSSKSLSNFTCAFGWGGSAVGTYSMSLGNSSNIANGQYSTCLGGKQNYSNDYAEVSIGQYSTNTTNSSDSYNENNVALRIGNGSSSSSRSDCMTVKFTGDLSLNKDICCNSIYLVNDVSCNSAEFKIKATAPTMGTNDDSTNIATTAFVKAKVDSVIGTAGSDYDTLGELATAVTSNSTTISNLNTTYATLNNPTFTGTVSGVTATHVGLGNVTNESKTTMFSSPTFTGTVSVPILTFDGSIKIGNNTTASHAESMAIGKDANAGAYQNSSAIGYGATVDANNTIQLGNTSMEFVNTSGTVTMASDIRLKDNITTLDGSLEKIKNIRGVSFTRNDLPNKNKKYIGVIAQELEKIIPEVVNDNGSYKSVMYNNLVGLLIEGIKDLSDKNDKLEKELIEVKKHLGL